MTLWVPRREKSFSPQIVLCAERFPIPLQGIKLVGSFRSGPVRRAHPSREGLHVFKQLQQPIHSQSWEQEYEIYRLDALDKAGISTRHLPFSLRILLENLLRTEDGRVVTAEEIRALAHGTAIRSPSRKLPLLPAASCCRISPASQRCGPGRDARRHERLGGDPALINPLQPAELVIDHSVQVDEFGTASAFDLNALLEFQRNKERYRFCAGDRPDSGISPLFLRIPESFTRSTWNSWRALFSSTKRRESGTHIPTPWSAPTGTPP